MHLDLLDDSLRVRVFFEKKDRAFSDNVCLCFFESCAEEERLFRCDETHMYLTAEQALTLARMLVEAAETTQRETGRA